MADFKFSCPSCGQHILCDTAYAGAQINCPGCGQALIVPQAAPSAAAPAAPPPPPAPSGLATRQSTMAPSGGRRFAGAPGLSGEPAPKPKSNALRNVLVIAAVVVVLAGLGVGGWFGYSKFKEHQTAKQENPAAQVATPTSASTMQALGILSKVHSAFTNLSGVIVDGTFTMYLDVSNITMADIEPDRAASLKNADRHPPGMPRVITNMTRLTFKGSPALTNWYYIAGDAVSKVDRMTMSNTFASWASDRGRFTFSDSHQRQNSTFYMQLPDIDPANDPSAQFKSMQHLFDDPANLAKIVKDLGQTGDASINGQDCYTLTAKVLGQKVKIWVDKTSYHIWQWQITLGGKISDADIDDAFSLVAAGLTNLPAAELEMVKPEVKKRTPMMTKIRGTLTFTCNNITDNPAFTSDDFNYPVPAGVRLIKMPNIANGTGTASPAATSLQNRQRNTCINNLRQIDAAKNQWALEKGKKSGDAVTEADIKPYLRGGVLPRCPAGGTYTIGKVGENPACSIAGHALP